MAMQPWLPKTLVSSANCGVEQPALAPITMVPPCLVPHSLLQQGSVSKGAQQVLNMVTVTFRGTR